MGGMNNMMPSGGKRPNGDMQIPENMEIPEGEVPQDMEFPEGQMQKPNRGQMQF